MFEHQKETVNCIASGKEQHITVADVYEISQTKNKKYRWKHAFQLPSVFQAAPVCPHYLRMNPDKRGEFNSWIRMDCAETAIKLKIFAKKCVAVEEENLRKKSGSYALKKKKLLEQSDGYSPNILLM